MMIRNNDYSEDAVRLTVDQDVNVRTIASLLYSRMLKLFRDNQRTPERGFHVLYFFQSVIDLWCRVHSVGLSMTTQFPLPCTPIDAVNWPNCIDGSQGFAKKYLAQVQLDSRSGTQEFDVSYALEILQLEFDAEGNFTEQPYEHPIARDEKNSFEDWLTGFASN